MRFSRNMLDAIANTLIVDHEEKVRHISDEAEVWPVQVDIEGFAKDYLLATIKETKLFEMLNRIAV